jgi:hypothetical protein
VSEPHSGTSYPRITSPPLDAAKPTSLFPRPRQPIAPQRRGGPRPSKVQVGLGFPGEPVPAEDTAEVDANLDRGDGAERQRGRGIAKVTSPISLKTDVSLKPLREFYSSGIGSSRRPACDHDRLEHRMVHQRCGRMLHPRVVDLGHGPSRTMRRRPVSMASRLRRSWWRVCQAPVSRSWRRRSSPGSRSSPESRANPEMQPRTSGSR